MKPKIIPLILLLIIPFVGNTQDRMSPGLLWSLNRVSAIGLTDDNSRALFSVTRYDTIENTKSTLNYMIPVKGGAAVLIEDYKHLITNADLSPDGKFLLSTKAVKVKKTQGKDFYPHLDKSNVSIYHQLNYRHWDQWEDGAYSHVFISPVTNGEAAEGKDIMEGEPYDCPQQPFGGGEDYLWNPDGTQVLYVTKKKYGTEYAVSTNTDIYAYSLSSGLTTNLTESNKGYDTNPAFSNQGTLAWLQMEEDGYESDKNDLVVMLNGQKTNLTGHWDNTVRGFKWADDSKSIYFTAAIKGTVHLFQVTIPKNPGKPTEVEQITEGQYDITSLVGQAGNTMVVSRTDMNHATELYTVNLKSGEMVQLTHVNDSIYHQIGLSRVEKRLVTTTDNREMVTWVIYPPDFDATRKYPTLLYCQGGPQGALSQFYSYRWNFQLMAAQGYIVVAPNRRGMPGYGVEWNEQISGDYGGQNMLDYLSAIDDVAGESYVDRERLGCVGASYGGYSVFYLAGIHEGRFKSFIAHDGIFNTRSMYGTTEELFFVNYDLGGAYWEQNNETVRKSFGVFNPIEQVSRWNTPIMIIQGGKDYRVPLGQSLEAFQAAQLLGIKSKLLYFPEENHWILSAQNGLVWQKEFFKWLEETL
ncbi:MAG: peptidase S9 [Cyclobacteriaceae bacterium]|nr:MAG: peptidase S9 [Cyclobacteriaceae bacterium]